MAAREQFSSRLGFIMAAAGSAVGLGNIWGFPTQTASNGGAAFVLVYLILAFCLAYPALMAELIIGRHAGANIVSALSGLSDNRAARKVAVAIGSYGVLVAALILSFYSIIAGWMLAYLLESGARMLGIPGFSEWLLGNSLPRNIIFMVAFLGLTMAVIGRGVAAGIERWSTRLMPMLLVLLIGLIVYVMQQKGASEGLRVYLQPDISQINLPLIISAMGQAFFSLSLGVGTMLIYGSYLSKTESLPKLGAIVTLVDTGIAVLAGLLIIPTIYVAKEYGAAITDAAGNLIAGPDLIFQVLPVLFDSMGTVGTFLGFAFFALLSIAALTSSISMLEVPVSLITERSRLGRNLATVVVGTLIAAVATTVLVDFEQLFNRVITLTTVYSQPLLGVALCVFATWVWHRNSLLHEIQQGHAGIEHSWFWKIWPGYVKFVCPMLILTTFAQSVWS